MALYDAHNHLQDGRFLGRQDELVAACRDVGVVRMVVNGSCEKDWPAVAEIARRYPDLVVPSFGLHPWHVHQRTPAWFDELRRNLDDVPGAVVGEIGIDRWILECPPSARAAVSPEIAGLTAAALPEQEEIFSVQIALATERNIPASIHCLQAWGRMHDRLRGGPRPACGFLLHSYGGPIELVEPLTRLGAYFGFPGYFLHARKARQRAVFRAVPAARLLVETDAPDQRLPATAEWHVAHEQVEGPVLSAMAAPSTEAQLGMSLGDSRPLPGMIEGWSPRILAGGAGQMLNHPADLALVYGGLASWLGESPEILAARVGEAFETLFGRAKAH